MNGSSDIRSRLFAPCAKVISQDGDVLVYYEDLLERLLLFDGYVLQSYRLQEIPHLVSTFGYDATLRLLNSDAIEIHYDVLRYGAIDKDKKPPGEYTLKAWRFEYKDSIARDMERLQGNPLVGTSKFGKLESAILSNVRRYPEDAHAELQTQLVEDLRLDMRTVREALRVKLAAKLGQNPDMAAVEIALDVSDSGDVVACSNIGKLFGWDEREVHELILSVLFAVGGVNIRVLQMKTHSAVSGLTNTDVPLLDGKLQFLEEKLSPETQVERLHRLLELGDFPILGESIQRKKVDLNRLLELRKTDEIRDFRRFLWSLDDFDDAEIKERLNSFKAKVAGFARSKVGKTVRWLATTGISFVEPVSGTAASALDNFLIDKALPKSGAVAFINDMYPSIFKGV